MSLTETNSDPFEDCQHCNKHHPRWSLCSDPQFNPANSSQVKSVNSSQVISVSATGGRKEVKPERYDLIPVIPWAEVAKVYGFGAAKYAEHNWRQGFEWGKSYAAIHRHLAAFWSGEELDPETGLPHLASVVFHSLALMEFQTSHPQYDDRYISNRKDI